MSKDNKNKKTETIRFRATQEFMKMLTEKMKDAKIGSLSQYMRDAVKNSNVIQKCENIEKIRYEINKIGINLNQLTKYVNTTGEFDKQAHYEIENISQNLSFLFEELLNQEDDS